MFPHDVLGGFSAACQRFEVHRDYVVAFASEKAADTVFDFFDPDAQDRRRGAQQHDIGGARDVVLFGQRIHVEQDDARQAFQVGQQVVYLRVVRNVDERRGVGR